jgi:hypothetical protein
LTAIVTTRPAICNIDWGANPDQGQNSLFPRAALQPKSLAGQEKSEERIGIRSSSSTNPAAIFAAT